MSNQMMGALLSPPDVRDYSVAAVSASAIPSTWKAPRLISKAGTQKVNNCVNFAMAQAHEMITGKVYSKGWVYANRETDDWQGEGMFPREAMESFVRDGNVLYADFPWEIEVPDAQYEATRYRDKLYSKGQQHRATMYASLKTTDEIKTARMKGLMVIASVPVGGRSPERNFVWHCDTGTIGNHMITIVDWSEKYPAEFKILNSWSENWGDKGYAYVSGADLLRNGNVFSAEVIDRIESEQQTVTRRTLRKGMSGGDVMFLKSTLVQFKYLHAATHATFGGDTERAVKKFQKEQGLKSDGIVGPLTWGRIDKLLGNIVLPTPVVRKDDIVAIETFIKKQVGKPYVYGAQGHSYSKEYINRRAEAAPSYFTEGRLEWMLKNADPAIDCFDCSGLMMAYLQGRYFTTDLSANGLYGKCKQIKRAEVQPGDILFRADSTGKMVHMAFVGYDGVYEAAGGCYGVVHRTSTFDRATYNKMTGEVDKLKEWTHYGRPKIWG